MDPILAGSLIGGGMNLFGGFMSNMFNQASSDDMIDWQRQFAQKGIQWRVKDAEKAGIHPLYALGAQTHQFSPVNISDSVGPAIGQAGSDIGRAVASRAENVLRKLQESTMFWDIQNKAKEGDILDLDAARRKLELKMMIDGQSDTLTPHIKAGKPSEWYERYKLGPGFEILAPRSQGEHPLEIIEAMSPLHRNAWIEFNSSTYGPGWKEMFYQWYWGGVPPGEHLKGDRR